MIAIIHKANDNSIVLVISNDGNAKQCNNILAKARGVNSVVDLVETTFIANFKAITPEIFDKFLA